LPPGGPRKSSAARELFNFDSYPLHNNSPTPPFARPSRSSKLIKILQGVLGARLHASDLVAALAAITIAAIVAYSSYRPFFIVGGGIALLRRTARKVNP
jgi:hypothetical protein